MSIFPDTEDASLAGPVGNGAILVSAHPPPLDSTTTADRGHCGGRNHRFNFPGDDANQPQYARTQTQPRGRLQGGGVSTGETESGCSGVCW